MGSSTTARFSRNFEVIIANRLDPKCRIMPTRLTAGRWPSLTYTIVRSSCQVNMTSWSQPSMAQVEVCFRSRGRFWRNAPGHWHGGDELEWWYFSSNASSSSPVAWVYQRRWRKVFGEIRGWLLWHGRDTHPHKRGGVEHCD